MEKYNLPKVMAAGVVAAGLAGTPEKAMADDAALKASESVQLLSHEELLGALKQYEDFTGSDGVKYKVLLKIGDRTVVVPADSITEVVTINVHEKQVTATVKEDTRVVVGAPKL